MKAILNYEMDIDLGSTCAKPQRRAPKISCLAEMSNEGRIRGSRERYQRKYCAVTT